MSESDKSLGAPSAHPLTDEEIAQWCSHPRAYGFDCICGLPHGFAAMLLTDANRFREWLRLERWPTSEEIAADKAAGRWWAKVHTAGLGFQGRVTGLSEEPVHVGPPRVVRPIKE